jgi:hypothetical protein
MRHALLTSAICLAATLAPGSASAQSGDRVGGDPVNTAVTQQMLGGRPGAQAIAVLNGFALGYFLGGSIEAGGRQILENFIAEMTTNYTGRPDTALACQDTTQPAADPLVTRTNNFLQSVWTLPDPSSELRKNLASFKLEDYLPEINVSVRTKTAGDTLSIRMVR